MTINFLLDLFGVLNECKFFLIYSMILSFILFSFVLNNNKHNQLNIFLITFLKWINKILICACLIVIIMSFAGQIHCDSSDSVSATVNLTTESAKIIGQSTSSAIGQIGLGASIGGSMSAGAKLLASSAMPPVQKLLSVAAIGITGAAIHVGSTHVNRMLTNGQFNNSLSTSAKTNTAYPDLFINSPLENWFNFSNYIGNLDFSILFSIDLHNPVILVLSSIFLLNLIIFFLLLLLGISLLARFIYNKDQQLNWIDRIFSHRLKKFKNFIKFLMKIYSKANISNIILNLSILLVASLGSNVLLFKVINNFPLMVKYYLEYF